MAIGRELQISCHANSQMCAVKNFFLEAHGNQLFSHVPTGAGNGGGGTSAPASGGTAASSSSGGTTTPGGGLYTSPGMNSLMQQMSENPTLMSQMMSAPYMQSMFNSLAANPEQAAAMISNSPVFAGNPQMQQQISQMMPQVKKKN